ncbi:MAG: hypothetical protein IK103_09295, partial [Bacteroidales bacterium]|nr:hypothetical protein [Bacteroidales bacterium]
MNNYSSKICLSKGGFSLALFAAIFMFFSAAMPCVALAQTPKDTIIHEEAGTYVGQVKIVDGVVLKEGHGVFYEGKKDNQYDGEWKNNLKNGMGTYIYEDGGKYVGEWKDDYVSGKGVFYYANKDRFEGEFKDGLRDGFGIYYYADGNRYEGEWSKHYICGKGKFFYTNGDVYEGDWAFDVKQGKGIY